MSRLELRGSGLELSSPVSHEARLMLCALAPVLRERGAVVYDIGAASGELTSAFAKVSSIQHVFAFEPLADSYRALVEQTGDSANVRAFRLALGDESGELELRRSVWRNTSSFLPVGEVTRQEFPLAARLEGAETVAVARLDDVVREHALPAPTLVKIDVQGFEDRVIRGAAQTLQTARTCVVELSLRPLYEGSPLFDDVYRLISDLGYRLTGFAGSLASRRGELLQVDAIFERGGDR